MFKPIGRTGKLALLCAGFSRVISSTPQASAQLHARTLPEVRQPTSNDQNAAVEAVDIVRDPADLPAPSGNREPQVVKVSLVAQELEGKLDPVLGATYEYWTFNGKVPGPMIRVRQGDTVELTLRNDGRLVSHSIDLHCGVGPWRRHGPHGSEAGRDSDVYV